MCFFFRRKIDTEKEVFFEAYWDPFYGKCVRFNSGKTMTGSLIPFRMMFGRGWDNAFMLSIDARISPMVWFSNETVDSTVNVGSRFSPGFTYEVKLDRTVIKKQPKPYSVCTADLKREDSYNSDVFRRSMIRLKNTNNRYF